MRTLKLNKETKQNIQQDLLKRSPGHYTEYEGRVNAIVTDVRERGDKAVFAYTRQFDGADISSDNVKVTDAEIESVKNRSSTVGLTAKSPAYYWDRK